jgi:hypothetical protein
MITACQISRPYKEEAHGSIGSDTNKTKHKKIL